MCVCVYVCVCVCRGGGVGNQENGKMKTIKLSAAINCKSLFSNCNVPVLNISRLQKI